MFDIFKKKVCCEGENRKDPVHWDANVLDGPYLNIPIEQLTEDEQRWKRVEMSKMFGGEY